MLIAAQDALASLVTTVTVGISEVGERGVGLVLVLLGSSFEDLVPQLPGGDDGVDPERQHHDDDDDLLGRDLAQVRRVRHQRPVQTDDRTLRGHARVHLSQAVI